MENLNILFRYEIRYLIFGQILHEKGRDEVKNKQGCITKYSVSSIWVTRDNKRMGVVGGDHNQCVLIVGYGRRLVYRKVHRHHIMQRSHRPASMVSKINFTAYSDWTIFTSNLQWRSNRMIESFFNKVLATFYEEKISFWVLGQDLDGLLSHVFDVGLSGFFIMRVVTIYIVLHVAGFEQTCQFHVIFI